MNGVQNILRQPSFIFHLSSFILLLLLAGCHGARQAAAPAIPDNPEAPEAPETPEPSSPRRTYTVLNFTGEVEGLSVSGQLRIAQDSAMWLSVNKYIEVARGLATPDSVWLRSPLLGIDRGADYGDLRQRLHRHISFADLQALALADDAEERISRLAKQLGFDATVRITRRQQVPALTFPYSKPKQ